MTLCARGAERLVNADGKVCRLWGSLSLSLSNNSPMVQIRAASARPIFPPAFGRPFSHRFCGVRRPDILSFSPKGMTLQAVHDLRAQQHVVQSSLATATRRNASTARKWRSPSTGAASAGAAAGAPGCADNRHAELGEATAAGSRAPSARANPPPRQLIGRATPEAVRHGASPSGEHRGSGLAFATPNTFLVSFPTRPPTRGAAPGTIAAMRSAAVPNRS